MIYIVEISKEEFLYIQKNKPNVQLVVLNKNAPSRKKTRLAPELPWLINLLKSYRSRRVSKNG